MRLLVIPGSKNGGTAEIGRAIAQELRSHGLDVDVSQPDHIHNLAPYAGFVIGSAIYMGEWLPASTEFVAQNVGVISERPTWLFSSGPVGEAQPREPMQRGVVARLIEMTGALGHRMFGGRLDLERLSRSDAFVARWVGAEDGDDRDWDEISTWSSAIADHLLSLGPANIE